MANRVGNRTESMAATTACITGGLDSQPSPSRAVDTSSIALEHILASIARLEARVDASERHATTTPQPPRPDPDPPYPDWQRGRDAGMRNRAVVTAATGVSSHPQLGFGGGLPLCGPNHAALAGTSPWDRDLSHGVGDRGIQPTAWDNPLHRSEMRSGRPPSTWDNAWSRPESAGYSDTNRFDHNRSDQPRHETMKAPRFDGSEAANWISRVQYYFEHMGTPDEHKLHYDDV